eukprot:m.32502 g.32502  ORF g.32502 m.32502 type:complete len:163 (-) comp10054_c0_seq1:85-573(-)
MSLLSKMLGKHCEVCHDQKIVPQKCIRCGHPECPELVLRCCGCGANIIRASRKTTPCICPENLKTELKKYVFNEHEGVRAHLIARHSHREKVNMDADNVFGFNNEFVDVANNSSTDQDAAGSIQETTTRTASVQFATKTNGRSGHKLPSPSSKKVQWLTGVC